MKQEIKYIELKNNGYNHNGFACIGLVSFSKSGKTIYFDGKGFKSLNGTGISGNYYEIESGDEYWISGVKKNMSDRHVVGNGKIFVEKRILNKYLSVIEKKELPKSYKLIEVQTEKTIKRINELENEKIETSKFSPDLYFKELTELTNKQINFLITKLYEEEKTVKFNKGRRYVKKKRMEFEIELEKRKIKDET